MILRFTDPSNLGVYGLVPTAETNVIALTSDSVCAQALEAFNAAAVQPGIRSATAQKVFVIRAGPTRYVVVDPELGSNVQLLTFRVFDEQWNHLALFGG